MRIGITMLSHDPTWGGIGIYTEEIVRHLLKIDRHNEYVLIYPGFGVARSKVGQYKRKYRNVEEVETTGSKLPLGTYWDQFVVPRVARRHDLDLLFNPFWSVPVFANYKKIMIVHNTEFHTVPGVYDWRRRLEWTLHDYVFIHRADAIISISNVMTQDLKRYLRLPAEKIRTIYHGCSDKFRVIRDKKRLRYAMEEYLLPEKFILFVGMLFPQKNFINLLRAFNKIARDIPHDIVVAGRPRWKYQEELQLIESMGLSDRIRFLYFVPNDDLPMIYNLADCFVYPSLYEGFGLAGLEAMACGCPMAAADAAAIPEVADGAALLFDPHDPDDIATAITTLLYDQAARDAYIEKGLARARLFTWDRAAEETLRLFRDVVGASQ